MKFIGIINDWIVKVLKILIAAAITVMIVVTCAEIVRRYFFGKTWMWSEELVRFIIIWITFVGGCVAYRSGALTRFDLVYGKLKERARDIVDLVTNQVVLLFLLFILYFGILKIQTPAVRLQKGIGLEISTLYSYISIPLGTAFMVLFNLESTYNVVKRMRERKGKGS